MIKSPKCPALGTTVPVRLLQEALVIFVRGSFSARVPRSSFARVRRVLVPHMVEEGEDQENKKEDEREDGQQRVEGRVVENQATHKMSAWRKHMYEVRATHQTWANVNVTLKCVLWNTRKCDVWGVLFPHPVGCSRLLSAGNDLATKKINLSKCHSEQLSEETSSTGRPVLWCRSFHKLKRNWLWWIYELHQWSFHCHHDVLDEKDDECHFWYC